MFPRASECHEVVQKVTLVEAGRALQVKNLSVAIIDAMSFSREALSKGDKRTHLLKIGKGQVSNQEGVVLNKLILRFLWDRHIINI